MLFVYTYRALAHYAVLKSNFAVGLLVYTYLVVYDATSKKFPTHFTICTQVVRTCHGGTSKQGYAQPAAKLDAHIVLLGSHPTSCRTEMCTAGMMTSSHQRTMTNCTHSELQRPATLSGPHTGDSIHLT